MATNKPISGFPLITGTDLEPGDLFVVVDVSNTSSSSTGTTSSVALSSVLNNPQNGIITGILVPIRAVAGPGKIVNTSQNGFVFQSSGGTLSEYVWLESTGTQVAALFSNGNFTVQGVLTGSGLLLTDAASQIVPGVTSIALRNHADTADNLLVYDVGDIIARGDFQAQTLIGGAIKGNSGAPNLSGTPASATGISLTGTDMAGRVAFTTGANSLINTKIATITFHGIYLTAPYPVVIPTTSFGGTPNLYLQNVSNLSFDVYTGAAINNPIACGFNYQVMF